MNDYIIVKLKSCCNCSFESDRFFGYYRFTRRCACHCWRTRFSMDVSFGRLDDVMASLNISSAFCLLGRGDSFFDRLEDVIASALLLLGRGDSFFGLRFFYYLFQDETTGTCRFLLHLHLFRRFPILILWTHYRTRRRVQIHLWNLSETRY